MVPKPRAYNLTRRQEITSGYMQEKRTRKKWDSIGLRDSFLSSTVANASLLPHTDNDVLVSGAKAPCNFQQSLALDGDLQNFLLDHIPIEFIDPAKLASVALLL